MSEATTWEIEKFADYIGESSEVVIMSICFPMLLYYTAVNILYTNIYVYIHIYTCIYKLIKHVQRGLREIQLVQK